MKKKYARPLFVFPVIVLLLFGFNTTRCFGQCAGQDGSMTICEIPDPVDQNIDLFSILGGNPDPGGDWSDDDGAYIFIGNPANGMVNIWNLNFGGIFHFTYTINDPNCSDNSATVTLIVGGYAGVDNFSANACENDNHVNLFQFIGSNPNPHLYGEWSDDSNTNALAGNIFDATIPGPGVYMFTYTVPAVGPCASKSVEVKLTVNELPYPGLPTDIGICGIEELSNFTNVDLQDYLSGEDPHGIWTESPVTSELSGPNDTFIDVENIFNINGYGTYPFAYTVPASHPVCAPQTAVIQVIIKRIIDFTGTNITVNPLCEDEVGSTDLILNFENLPGLDDVPNYNYVIHYQITGPVSFSGEDQISPASPSFSLDDDFVPTPGVYTITITDISTLIGTDDLVCAIVWDLSTDFEIKNVPDLDNATLTIPDICQGENATATISNATDLEDGTYTITYIISGANIGSNTIDINVQNGTADFDLDSLVLSDIGSTTVVITSISDEFCDNTADLGTTFEVNPLPNPDDFTLTIENVCFGDPILISLDNLVDLDHFELTYSISGANSISNQTVELTTVNNSAEFTLPANLFSSPGTNIFHIDHIINLETGCESDATNTQDFEIYALPDPPQAETQEFCEIEDATVADLIPNGTDYLWYENETDTSSLPETTLLTQRTYWVVQVDDNGCISEKTPVSVIINHVPPLTLIPDGANFCGADHPTIADLSANTNQFNAYEITWYDSDGNLLDENTPLVEGSVYFGYTSDSITNCETSQALEVTISLTDCGNDPDDYDFFIPDAFSPNGDGLNDTFRIKNIQYIFPDYQFEIYNRYGKLLFKGGINHPEWDGRTSEGSAISGGVVPNGVYFYIIKFNKNDKPPQQGRLFLNR